MALSLIGRKAEANETVKKEIRVTAKRYGIDPKLALAIARVESGFNPNAVGKLGEVGVFQLMPYNVCSKSNVECGIRLLKQYRIECKDMGEAWFICYNNGVNRRPKHPKLFPYYKKVMLALKDV